MLEHPPHLSPEQRYLRTIYLGYLSSSKPLETFVTWVLTGVAAMIALLVSNADSISKIVSHECFRSGMILLTLSLLPGVLSKNFGMGIQQGLVVVDAMYAELFS